MVFVLPRTSEGRDGWAGSVLTEFHFATRRGDAEPLIQRISETKESYTEPTSHGSLLWDGRLVQKRLWGLCGLSQGREMNRSQGTRRMCSQVPPQL